MNEPLLLTRRNFLARSTLGLGALALGNLLGGVLEGATANSRGSLGPHFPARAKRVIYLFQSGGPSQLELFDEKLQLKARFDQELARLRTDGPTHNRNGFGPGAAADCPQ